MQANPDSDVPAVLCVSKSEGFASTILHCTDRCGLQFLRTLDLTEASELLDSRHRLMVVVDYASKDVFNESQIVIKLREVLALIVVTPPDDPEAEFHAACMGAFQIVRRPIPLNAISSMIQTVLRNSAKASNLCQIPVSILVEQYDGLTARQHQVLRLLLRGEPNKRIASSLDLSLRTIESERASMMRSFGVNSLAELVQCATIAV